MLSEFWSDLRYRLRAIFRRSVVEQELDDELRFHVLATAMPAIVASRPDPNVALRAD